MRRDVKDMAGVRFGDRVAVDYVGKKKWRTRCACGRVFVVAGADLRRSKYKCQHDAARRFWAKVKNHGDCMLWTASLTKDGYGRFRAHGRLWLAHAFVWRLAHGEAGPGLELDHLCRNRSCVRVDHLEPVTHAVNVRRGRLGEVTRARFAARREAA